MATKTHRRHQSDHGALKNRISEQQAPTPAPQPATKISAEELCKAIQLRAYYLWEKASRPDGDEARVRCWCQAEKEVGAEHNGHS